MRISLALAILLAALIVTGCAPRPVEAPPTARAGSPGFDTWRYPGTETMRAWRQASPYEWTGYYLPSPCHRGTSFAGRRAELEQMGWGIAVLYVGQQTWDGVPPPEEEPEVIICSRTLLTEAEGQRNGQDAIQKMVAEGFPVGSTIFLNVERMDALRTPMATYYRAWIETVLEDGRFVPGTYAHRTNAEGLFGIARAAFVAHGRDDLPPLWVAGGPGFTLDSAPRDVGLPFVQIWQGILDVERTWAEITLTVDENVATSSNPSAPLPTP